MLHLLNRNGPALEMQAINCVKLLLFFYCKFDFSS